MSCVCLGAVQFVRPVPRLQARPGSPTAIHAVHGARHADFNDKGFGANKYVDDEWSNGIEGVYDVEADERYQRADLAAVHAFHARKAFVDCISDGEANIDLAEAALAIAAEDDALVTHSTVPFPMAAYRQRIARLASDCQRIALVKLPSSASPADIIAAVEHYLYDERGYSLPPYGRTNMPAASIVEHAGVWEDYRLAYLPELLGRPSAEALPLPRAAVLLPGGGVLNTCSSEALVEMLRHLKRSFWPFAWDTSLDATSHDCGVGSQGGFRAAASEAIEGPVSARIQVIAKAAANRLERGVWTSPGAGDIRRSLAACERLVLLADQDAPWERRDLGVLYMFRGMPERAKAELLAYSATEHAKEADIVDQRYVGGLLDVLKDVVVQPDDEALSLDFYSDAPVPDPSTIRPLPLTW